jgi:hypothetical protein
MKNTMHSILKPFQRAGKAAIKLLFRPVYLRWSSLEGRVMTLEVAIDNLLAGLNGAGSEDFALNGQRHRQQIFDQLLSTFPFEAIVETGTFTGNTAGYMARKTNLPVYTVERNPRFHTIAKTRLKDFQNITFALGDSRTCLSKFAGNGVAGKNTFFYLDAHWNEDLPLAEEIEIIGKNWKRFVIMIDDFQVPGDNGYGYDDDYGWWGRGLDMRSFAGVFSRCGLTPFFPAAPSASETGAKRGCVVLVKNEDADKTRTSVPALAVKA